MIHDIQHKLISIRNKLILDLENLDFLVLGGIQTSNILVKSVCRVHMLTKNFNTIINNH